MTLVSRWRGGGFRLTRSLLSRTLLDHKADLHVALPEVVAEPAITVLAPTAAPGILDAERIMVVVESDRHHGVTAPEVAVVLDDAIASPSGDGRADPHAEDHHDAAGELLLDHREVGGVETAPGLDAVARGALLLGSGRLASAPSGVEDIFLDRQRADVLQNVERRRCGNAAGVIPGNDIVGEGRAENDRRAEPVAARRL